MNKLLVFLVLCLILSVALGEVSFKKRVKSLKHRTAKHLATKHRAHIRRDDPPADAAAPAPDAAAGGADAAAGGADAAGGANFQTC